MTVLNFIIERQISKLAKLCFKEYYLSFFFEINYSQILECKFFFRVFFLKLIFLTKIFDLKKYLRIFQEKNFSEFFFHQYQFLQRNYLDFSSQEILFG